MTRFTHRSRHTHSRRLLPGHGTPTSKQPSASGSLPGVNRTTQQARRAVWTYDHARRFDQTEVASRFTMAIAIGVMLIGMIAALSGSSPLERAHAIQASADAAPVTLQTNTLQANTPPNT